MRPSALVLTGDILPTRDLSEVADDVRQALGFIRRGDLAIGNFEMPLTDRGHPVEKLLNIRADPSIARGLPVLGLDLVTLANNHAADYGCEGLAQTAAILRECGLRVIGTGKNLAEAMRPAILSAGEARVGVIAFSCLLPPGMAAAAGRPGISPIHIHTSYRIDPYYQMEEPGDLAAVKVGTTPDEADLQAALAVIGDLKRKCDLLVVTIHWGFGSGQDLAEYQLPLARRLIDAGADVIHGHHPHAIHPVGFYKGKPILFSLGTLVGQQVFLEAAPAISALWAEMSPDGCIATISFSDSGAAKVWLVPTVLNADRLPILAAGEAFDRIHARLSRLSRPYGGKVERDGPILRVKPLSPDH